MTTRYKNLDDWLADYARLPNTRMRDIVAHSPMVVTMNNGERKDLDRPSVRVRDYRKCHFGHPMAPPVRSYAEYPTYSSHVPSKVKS